MNYVDIVLLVPIGYAAYKGFKNGLIIEVFTLLALLVGLYAGIHFSDATAGFLKESAGFDSEYMPIIAFTLTFLAVGAMVYFGGKMLEKVVDVVHLTPINKFFGVLFALIKVLYILSVLIVIIESYDEKGDFVPEDTKENSLLYVPVRQISLTTIPKIEESTIFMKNAFKDEQDSTGLTIEQILRAKEVADSLGIDAEDAKSILEIHEKYGEE